MTNSKELFSRLVNKIVLNESKEEVKSIAFLLLENQFGLTKTDVLLGKALDNSDPAKLEEIILRINRQEPIQYILGEAWFYGRKFKVDADVLIPRPETELIVKELTGNQFIPQAGGSILDIGTGSGCLAVTLARELPGRKVIATDVSGKALKIAMENAKRNKASVDFLHHNILVDDLSLIGIEFIVSNPPYITQAEKSKMKKNVLDYEPFIALFVPDEDPLVFYKAIAQKGRRILTSGGKIIVEINAQFGKETAQLFANEGYLDVLIKKDFASKDRFVLATSMGMAMTGEF